MRYQQAKALGMLLTSLIIHLGNNFELYVPGLLFEYNLYYLISKVFPNIKYLLNELATGKILKVEEP